MKVENKKILYGFQATVTILIFILLGSNKGLDNERFTYFFDSYAKEYQHVSLTRATAVAWFIRKNNFYNQYLNFGENPVYLMANYVTYLDARRDLENPKKSFEAGMQLNKLNMKDSYEKHQ